MADVFETIQKFINSPPGQIAAGGVLAGIVWKFFERVEAVLTESTKHELARWLRVKSFESGIVADESVNWPETFAKIFDRVFGRKHLSWHCFRRSALSTYIAFLFSMTILTLLKRKEAAEAIHLDIAMSVLSVIYNLFAAVFTNILPDYLSLLETRYLLSLMAKSRTQLITGALLVLDLGMTGLTGAYWLALFSILVESVMYNPHGTLAAQSSRLSYFVAQLPELRNPIVVVKQMSSLNLLAHSRFYPAFLTSLWLWLYAASGFLLKLARRSDLGFDWFNRKFDIEHKPLQSIGLVAGALVAVVYWAAVIGAKLSR